MNPRVFLVALVAVLVLGDVVVGQQPSQDRSEQLLSRLQKMLDAQTAIHNRTKALHKIIDPNKKMRAEEHQVAMKLAASEKDILAEVARSIDDLKAVEAAAAVLDVFEELRKDIERLEGRLKDADVGPVTQALEQDIVETLKEMVASLKKG